MPSFRAAISNSRALRKEARFRSPVAEREASEVWVRIWRAWKVFWRLGFREEGGLLLGFWVAFLRFDGLLEAGDGFVGILGAIGGVDGALGALMWSWCGL